MEKNKMLNLIAGIAGAAGVAAPASGNTHYDSLFWMVGVFAEEGDSYPMFDFLSKHEIPLATLSVVAFALILAATAMFFLSMLPKMKMPILTMLGWILGLGGSVVFIIFGFVASLDGPTLFLDQGFYPLSMIAAIASGILGLVSWIGQSKK